MKCDKCKKEFDVKQIEACLLMPEIPDRRKNIWFFLCDDCLEELQMFIKNDERIKTIKNCSLIKKMRIKPYEANGKCEGFQKSEFDDEPCEICKHCRFNMYIEED